MLPQSLRFRDRDYWLVPMARGENSLHSRNDDSELQRFDSEDLKDVPEFKYTPLTRGKKRIRLLRLMSGTISGSQIFCELIDAGFDNPFHIPTILNSSKGSMTTEERPLASEEETRINGGEASIDEEAAPSRHKTVKNNNNQSQKKNRLSERSAEGMTKDNQLRFRTVKERKTAKMVAEDEGKEAKLAAFKAKRSKVEHRTDDEKKRLEKEEEDCLVEKWKEVKRMSVGYEALSWCWGDDDAKYVVLILQYGKIFKKRVRKELALALKYLRLRNQIRTLWVDAICINQDDPEERNHQVQMMSRVYTRANEVCVWLGEHTDDSKIAIDFIREDILELKNFDAICSDKAYSYKWQALMMLMQSPWFSRRWVVQELALARKATVYCGRDHIAWKDFAVAVELFVEVETATHRLSEIMQKDEKLRHTPGRFEYVSELGASLLVQATGRVFRAQRTPMRDSLDQFSLEQIETEEFRKRLQEATTLNPLERRSLLSLEHLVSTMFTFQASELRDVVYALLAIARDVAPFTDATFRARDKTALIMMLCDSFLEEKPFAVDYSRQYSDVCRDFVQFTIRRKAKLDPVQALDILCRPWALSPSKGKSIRVNPRVHKGRMMPKRNLANEPWEIRRYTSEKQWKDGKLKWTHVESEEDVLYRDKRNTSEYWKEVEKKEIWEEPEWKIPDGWESLKNKYFLDSKIQSTASRKPTNDQDNNKENEKDLELPKWVGQASQAPFSLYHHPGIDVQKIGRVNADPLVGHPADGHRNYSAAETRPVNLNVLKFKKRPKLDHYSLYVQGFELDDVQEVSDASQGGNIPKAWLEMAGWKEGYQGDPPDELWRTLVADRGRDNRNPPYYYVRACKESIHKGGIWSGSVNTTALINNERSSIVAEFCRRVHAVIWNRRMFKTKNNRLGLAFNVHKGDKICILYGCTVPVILSQQRKKEGAMEEEDIEDRIEALKACIRRCEQSRQRKAAYWPKKAEYLQSGEWYEMMNAKEVAEQNLRKLAEKKQNAERSNLTEINEHNPSHSEGSQGLGSEKGELGKALTVLELSEQKAEDEDKKFFYLFNGECYLHGMMDGEDITRKFL